MAEVLAALLFMAIVIPVAVEGLRVASLAGVVAERKREAVRVADRILSESLVTTNWNKSVQSGSTVDGGREFRWTLRLEPWGQGTVQQLSADVHFTAQGRDYAVRLDTLVNAVTP